MPTPIFLFSARCLFVHHGERVANAAQWFTSQLDVEWIEQGKRDASG